MTTWLLGRRAAILGGVVAPLLARARLVRAHAFLDAVEPPPGPIDAVPSRLVLGFSGDLDRGSTIRLLDAAGDDVPGVYGGIDPADRTRLVATVPECPPGAYTVAWVAASVADGHEVPGFHGLLAGGAPAPIAGAAPVVTDGAESDLTVDLAPVAATDGTVTWIVRVGGETAPAVQRVLLTFAPPRPEIGSVQVTCRANDDGFLAAPFLPTMVGEWRIEAVVRRDGVRDDVRRRFSWVAVSPVPPE